MRKGKRFGGNKRQSNNKYNVPKKKKKKSIDKEFINKKAIFNRYKNKNLDEVLEKKKQLDKQLQEAQAVYSESEEEEDAFSQLVSCFGDTQKVGIGSDEESDSDVSEDKGVSLVGEVTDDITLMDKDNDTYDSSDQEKLVNEPDTEEIEQEDVATDPFTIHLQHELSDEMLVSLSNKPSTVDTITKCWPVLGNVTFTILQPLEVLAKKAKPKISLLEDKTYAATGSVPHLFAKVDFKKLHIKSQLHGNIVSANKTNLIKADLELSEVFTPLQKELFAIINNYQDLYFPSWRFSNAEEIRFTYCLHVVNHLMKTRTKILHHNAKLSKKTDLSDEYRDQGLVRPKVLILVPFKSCAYKVVKTLIDIAVPKEAGQVINRSRFEADFTGGELHLPRKNPKPEDYELMFQGNTDDCVRLGLSITKKTMKLYTDFYSSDVLIASPLGLRTIIGAEGEADRDYDFLASIEVLVVEQCDVFLMQNWEHLLHTLLHLHCQPRGTHTDISRVRTWAASGHARYYRQSLVFSAVQLPEIQAVVSKRCENYRGRAAVCPDLDIGTMPQVLVQVPQIFHRFEASSPVDAVSARRVCFLRDILPRHREPLMSHTLLYVPSYFDYVALRNHFKKEDISFVQICEYSKEGKVARARDMFFHSEAPLLLYSERAHFFSRRRIKGVRHLVFYQPPTYPHFYTEICNLMQESNQNKFGGSASNMSVTTLYCKYDAPRVAAITGQARAARMVAGENHVTMYVTGQ